MNDPTLFDLSSVFSTVAGAVPDQEMLVWRERRLTYGEVDRRIDALAAYLRMVGLGCHTERKHLARHESGQDHTALYPHWDDAANSTVAMLRIEAGRNPYDRDLSDLIGELSTRSETFRSRWAAHNVVLHRAGRQTVPSPCRRRPQPCLRGHGTLGRHRPDPHRLQPRTEQPIGGRSGPARQLGRDTESK